MLQKALDYPCPANRKVDVTTAYVKTLYGEVICLLQSCYFVYLHQNNHLKHLEAFKLLQHHRQTVLISARWKFALTFSFNSDLHSERWNICFLMSLKQHFCQQHFLSIVYFHHHLVRSMSCSQFLIALRVF